MSDDDAIKGRNDFPPPSTLPPQAKTWNAAGPFVLSGLILLVTLVGTLTGNIEKAFLQKVIEWAFIGMLASSTPKGVFDAIKAMMVKE